MSQDLRANEQNTLTYLLVVSSSCQSCRSMLARPSIGHCQNFSPTSGDSAQTTRTTATLFWATAAVVARKEGSSMHKRKQSCKMLLIVSSQAYGPSHAHPILKPFQPSAATSRSCSRYLPRPPK